MTAPKKDTTPDYRKVTLVPNGASLTAEYNWHLYRFLMSDGRTVDITAVRDDSDLRAAVLAATNANAICGVAVLAEPAEPEKVAVEQRKVAKRVAVRPKPA